jgi:hypothetical protein
MNMYQPNLFDVEINNSLDNITTCQDSATKVIEVSKNGLSGVKGASISNIHSTLEQQREEQSNIQPSETTTESIHTNTYVAPVFVPKEGIDCRHFPDQVIFQSIDTVKTISGIITPIRKAPIEKLKKIHKDKKTATELTIFFLSYFTQSQNYHIWGDRAKEIVNLSSELLKRTFGKNYKKIVSLAVSTGIIKPSETHREGVRCKGYKLTPNYIRRGAERYTMTTPRGKDISARIYMQRIEEVATSEIAQHLFRNAPRYKLPSIPEIEQEATRLIKLGYTHRGKKLTRLNKKAKSTKDTKKYMYVEDCIKLYRNLTTGGLSIPSVSKEKAGGRITDSFNRMPKWIRKLIRIDHEATQEIDYTCLHPNIIMKLYGDNKFRYISHKKIGCDIGVDPDVIKKKHLKFFNKTPHHMRSDKRLFSYYSTLDSKMMMKIISEKETCNILPYGERHKITSMKLFSQEVAIMTDVIKELNTRGIAAIYVYDALQVKKSDYDTVKEIMDRIILEHKVYTKAA